MIAFAKVSIGTGGTSSCSACSASSAQGTPRSLQDVAGELASFASSWAGGPGPNVAFEGFEPFAHPELPQLIDAAASRGFERIRLRTDAGALSQPGNADGVLGAGVRQLEVVVLGASAEEHDRLAGRRGLLVAARAGVAAYVAAARARGASFDVSGYVPVCRHNVAQLPQVIALLAEMGATSVEVDACGLKVSDRNHEWIAAAMETATFNRVAGFVTGWERPLGGCYDRRPWQVAGEAS